MEDDPPSPHHPPLLPRAEVDTTRPFRSVREAVAVFGDRLLAGDVYIHKPPTTPKLHETPAAAARPPPPPLQSTFSPSPPPPPPPLSPVKPTFSPSPSLPHNSTFSPNSSSSAEVLNREGEEDHALVVLVKRLEAELEETKRELRQLKARESETEIALASLNAELHKSMSRFAEAEALEAGKAAAKSGLMVGGVELDDGHVGGGEKQKKVEFGMMGLERSASLAEILSIGDKEGYFGMTRKEKKTMKKKPVVPLIGDMFPRKRNSFGLYNPLFRRSHAY